MDAALHSFFFPGSFYFGTIAMVETIQQNLNDICVKLTLCLYAELTKSIMYGQGGRIHVGIAMQAHILSCQWKCTNQ